MVTRRYWLSRIEQAWERRPIVWLSGVRRAGKTYLCQSIGGIEYFDCEQPRVRQQMDDPEAFLDSLRGKRLALDEVHRLRNPSELLKIAADHFLDIKIVATGSSTLEASAVFKDTLTGRKSNVWLTPLNQADLADFESDDLRRRLVHGGLPPFFLDDEPQPDDYLEWLDSYWAKDVQELFRLERRRPFEQLLELLFASSGGIFEATRYAAACEISRQTVSNYLGVLEASRVVHVIRPFSRRQSAEIVSAPKVYGFDSGFVRYFQGWRELRPEDLGLLWEHYVLNEVQSLTQQQNVLYWRDKRGHEIDFVCVPRGQSPIAIECKWQASAWTSRQLKAFRFRYPDGENWVVGADVQRPYTKRVAGLVVQFLGTGDLSARMSSQPSLAGG